MWDLFFMLSVVSCVFTVTVAIISGIEEKIAHKKTKWTTILFIGGWLAAFFLLIPIYQSVEDGNGLRIFLRTFSDSVKVSIAGTNYSDISDEIIAFCPKAIQNVYRNWAVIVYVLSPAFTLRVLYDILSKIFPKIKIHVSYMLFWKKKLFFSELNEASLAVFKSLQNGYSAFKKPIMIFTNVSTGDKSKSELISAVKVYGGICVPDDLRHVPKNRFGAREIFLTGENESKNLKLLSDIVRNGDVTFLEKSKVYLFTQSDAYVQVESQVMDILKDVHGFTQEELPEIFPFQRYRNMISKMLVDVPLYEPLIGRKPDKDGIHRLNVTVLGAGEIGIEMFLSSYWICQMLNVETVFNIVSKESEQDFRDKINAVNPEIYHTATEGHEILRYNSRGDLSNPYCKINYVQCDVNTSDFMNLKNRSGEEVVFDADYIFAALGTDEKNISAAESICRNIGIRHINEQSTKRTVIAYVVYDSELSAVSNQKKRYCHVDRKRADIYMFATGNSDELYSYRSIAMLDYVSQSDRIHKKYMELKSESGYTLKTDYRHWTNIAREMHKKYKAFSLGYAEKSVFDFKDEDCTGYDAEQKKMLEKYRSFALDGSDGKDKEHIRLKHELAWLEHRRWNAFMRIKGYRSTDAYNSYMKIINTYQHWDLKLHPCLVECDKYGIRPANELNEKESKYLDNKRMFRRTEKTDSEPDFLDKLTLDLKKDEDFKLYDYPFMDFSDSD